MSSVQLGYVRQRASGLWEGQYLYQGKRYSVYDSQEYMVRIQLHKIIETIVNGEFIKLTEYTLESWLKEWIKTYGETYLRPSTYINYEAMIQRHVLPYFGKIRLKNVSTGALQKFFNCKIVGGRLDNKKGGLSPKTLKNMKYMLNVAFGDAYYNRHISYNPVAGVKLPVLDDIEQKCLEEKEKNKLLRMLSEYQEPIAKGVIILLSSGLRRGELLALKWEDIDFNKNTMKIRHTLSRLKKFELSAHAKDYIRVDKYADPNNKTALYMGPVKTKKANRTIYLPKSVRIALNELLLIQTRYMKNYCGECEFNPYGFVLCNVDGRSIEQKVLETGFKKYLAKAHLKQVNLHATRHTFATEALQKASDIVTVSAVLGHEKPSTTLDMYGHTFDDRKKALMEQFE